MEAKAGEGGGEMEEWGDEWMNEGTQGEMRSGIKDEGVRNGRMRGCGEPISAPRSSRGFSSRKRGVAVTSRGCG